MLCYRLLEALSAIRMYESIHNEQLLSQWLTGMSVFNDVKPLSRTRASIRPIDLPLLISGINPKKSVILRYSGGSTYSEVRQVN
jgi:hypothetical protein